MNRPTTIAEFNKRRAAFEAWLLANGSAILAPTNPFEVIRFVGQNATCVVYRNQKNVIQRHHWQHGAADAFDAFDNQDSWRATRSGVPKV